MRIRIKGAAQTGRVSMIGRTAGKSEDADAAHLPAAVLASGMTTSDRSSHRIRPTATGGAAHAMDAFFVEELLPVGAELR